MGARTAVAYVRVSTEEQVREGLSLDAQEARLRAYATLQGLELLGVYRDEGVSASKPLGARPAGARVLGILAEGSARHVLALKLDRLFRDAVDCLRTAQEWDQAGVAMHLVDLGGQTVNTATAMGRFFLTVMAGAAEMERNLIGERTRTALAHKRFKGERLGGVPLGVRVAAGADQPVEDELAQVRLILRRRARGVPFRTIAAELTRAGHRTKRGGAWHRSTVRAVWGRRKAYRALLSA